MAVMTKVIKSPSGDVLWSSEIATAHHANTGATVVSETLCYTHTAFYTKTIPTEADHPAFARVWDNDADAVYDDL